jgi:peptidyl-prolyl cis-trans isomerase D
MAIIGSIQSKGRYFLIGFVGLALLTFILSDLTKCSGPRVGNQGSIGGEPVDADKYYQNVVLFTQNDSARIASQEQRMMTEKEMEQSRDRAWSATVDETLLSNEFEALGIDVSDKEFHAYLYGENGFTLMQDIAQSFTDQMTGKFNPKELDRFIQGKESSKNAVEKKQWEDTKRALKLQRKQEKYFQLLSQGVYVTKLEAKNEYRAQRELKSVSFIVRNFRDIPDEDIKISEKEVKDFYEEHKSEKKYEVLAGRDVKYFDVSIQPSKADSATFNTSLTKLKAEFAAAKDDSAFVVKNTESQMRFPKTAVPYRAQGDPNAKGQTYPAYMDTVFRTAGVGTVVGPYTDQGKTYLAKVLGVNSQSLSARHILLPAQRTDATNAAAQRKLADSLTAILKTDKTRFEEFVNTYSTDQGSKQQGGKYDDFSKDEFVPEFSDFVIANPVGTIGVVQTDFGFHIIEVLGKKDAHIPLLAVIEKTLVPSIETQDNLKDKAYDLLYEIDSKISKLDDPVAKLVLFDTIARREGFFARPVRMSEEAPRAQGFATRQAEMKIIQMAFQEDAEVGQLCPAPISDEGRYVIAIVSSIRKEKGEPAYADVYERMRVEAIKEKKAQKFIGQIGKSRDLNALAKKFNTTVNNAEITFANPSIQGGGYEPEIVGSLFSGLKDGATTLPLTGNAGVYVFRLNKTTKAPAAANYDTERKQIASQARQSQQQEVMQALRKKAEVYDNRILTELGIYR